MSEIKSKIRIVDSNLMGQRDYWLKQFSRELQPTNLKLDYSRDDTAAPEMETVEFGLMGSIFRKLAQVSNNSQFLLYRTLMAGLQICLHKHTSNNVVVVGTPPLRINGAPNQSLNALPVLSEIDPHISFREFLVNVRETLSQVYKNQDYPFGRLSRDLKLTPPENRCALFDVSIMLANIHTDLLDVKNDIAISLSESGDAISGSVTYNSALFMRDSIERFIRQFETALSNGLENPEVMICDLEVLPDAERRRILVEWNDNQRDYLQNQCIPELFESQVDRTPECIALEMNGSQLTYGELNRASNKLARFLRAKQVGPEVRVGVCLERSLEQIIGVLGVLKAGGAFVPLDPHYPAQRLEYMLRDSRIQVLLTQRKFRESLPGITATTICLDSDWPVIENESDENGANNTTADNLAYMIYTSGSTGRPKGALLQHRGVRNLADAQVEAFDVQPGSRVLQFASLSFDASVSEIFMALTIGATLHLGGKEPMAGAALSRLLNEEAISVATIPPATLVTLPGADLPALQTLIVAGESCPPAAASHWSIGRRFFNAYGPTETSVCASIFECIDEYRDGIPIGRPMANVCLYLLDSRSNPVPTGAAGEIHIGGIGIARGYFNRPDLTAERFIPDPFAGQAGKRLYRAGDLGRHMFDGTIQYLGRTDHQVKLRGFRIELGEIESALCQHPAVRGAVAQVWGDSTADKRLIAYVVSDQSSALLEGELRSFLRDRIPEYMMPSTIVRLESLPQTSNGKVDRRALPTPSGERPASGETFVAARNTLEELLQSIWVEALKIDQIGVEDNFFELGGNSLIATQVMSRVYEALQVEFPLRTLFESPTIASLATSISRTQGEVEQEEAPVIDRICSAKDDGTGAPRNNILMISERVTST